MIVYVVMKTTTQSFENDACWDDGWYDDYYETEVTSEELIGIYATEELAKEAVNKYEDKCHYNDSIYYVAYEVLNKVEDLKDD